MDDPEELWQRRMRELYDHVEELYPHVDISVVVFERQHAEVGERDSPVGEYAPSSMASLLLWQAVLRGPIVDSVTRIQALDAIHDAAAGQAPLIDELVDIARAINGTLRVQRAPTSVGRVLTTAVATARQLAEARHLAIVADFDADVGDVLGDARRLRQIFENVLSNAIKCTARGGILIRARQRADSITIEVSDTGRGIDPELLPHVFEAFRQSDDRPAGVGLGLGLAIARELVELHEGTISAASDGEGRGATFTVTLPRVRETVLAQ